MAEIQLDDLDRAAAEGFDVYIVRKDLVRRFARQYPVPTYVVEFLRGRYCATIDADEILVMHHGVVAERGAHASLLAQKGLYERLWRLQVGDV